MPFSIRASGFVTCCPFGKSGAHGTVASGTTNSLLCLLPSQNFYNQVSTPLLKKIQFNYPQESVSDVTQSSFHNYFGGSEIVVAGKVDTENLQHLESIVTATAVSEGIPRIPAPGLWAGSFTRVHSLFAGGYCQQSVLSTGVLGGIMRKLIGSLSNNVSQSKAMNFLYLHPAACQRNFLLINVPYKIQLQTRLRLWSPPSCFVKVQWRSSKVDPFMAEPLTVGEFKLVGLHCVKS